MAEKNIGLVPVLDNGAIAGAVITLLAVTGPTHRQADMDIFVITVTRTVAVFHLTGLC